MTEDTAPDFSSLDSLPELTLRGMLLGALITIVFTSSNVYLGLKVGLTFSSSIPAAVISMAVLSFFSRSNILENNMVQTQASAAGTLSAVIFVLPALLMVGYWNNFHFWQTMLICTAGGALGVVFSIPLRRTMVVNSDLPYPEGVAAAQILKAGHSEKSDSGGAKDILFGGIFAAIIAFTTSGLNVLVDKTGLWFSQGRAIFQIPVGFSLALVSAGYLMGIAAGLSMLIGVVLAWGAFVPYLTAQMSYTDSIMDVGMQVWSGKVRFIGAGTLAVAAVWTLLTLAKSMVEGIKLSFAAIRADKAGHSVVRTDLDMSMTSLLRILVLLVAALVVVFYTFIQDAPLSPVVGWSLVIFGVFMVFCIGFFTAAACGYMAGLIGSSNSPISGIGVVAVIIVSALLMGMENLLGLLGSPEAKAFGMALALFVTTGVVCSATIANDNLQDLKTGLLVGATPKNQQIALFIGCCVGALVIAPVLDILYQAYGFAGTALPRPDMDPHDVLSAPQATLMMTVAKGIFAGNLDWSMFVAGAVTGAVMILIDMLLGKMKSRLRVSALAVGLGIYLPPSVTAAIVIGALLNVLVGRTLKKKGVDMNSATAEHANRGVLIASGFIVGESLTGVVLAIAILASLSLGFGDAPFSISESMGAIFGAATPDVQTGLSLLVFALACLIFFRKSVTSK